MFETRDMCEADLPACAAILNHIIRRGGTTAYEDTHDLAHFRSEFLAAPELSLVVHHDGRIVGFQCVYAMGDGLYSIGSFTDQARRVKGAGRALFAATQAACRTRNGVAIEAYITSDNAPGLAYYSALGFRDMRVIPADVTRSNGTVVDRVVKRFDL